MARVGGGEIWAYQRGLTPAFGIQGLRQFTKHMKQFKEDYSDMRQAMKDVGQRGKREAQSRVPIDKGLLRRDHSVRTAQNSVKISVGKKADYVWYVHFGAPALNQEARPWLYEAVGANKDYTERRLKKEMDRLCRKYGAPWYA